MDQFEQFLLQAGDGAFAIDPRRQVVFWNPGCERLLGVSARAALGQTCCEVVRGCDASGELYCGPRCGPGGLAQGGAAPKPMPLWFAGKNGTRLQLWLSVFLVPSRWQDLWTVVHVLQRKPHALVPALPDAPGAAKCLEKSTDAGVLTPREQEILGMLAQGHCVAEISRRISISPVTVRNHVQHLTAKLGLHSQLEAVAYAYRNDLV
jgi:DNA-binding CsgD family transcriptional regulator